MCPPLLYNWSKNVGQGREEEDRREHVALRHTSCRPKIQDFLPQATICIDRHHIHTEMMLTKYAGTPDSRKACNTVALCSLSKAASTSKASTCARTPHSLSLPRPSAIILGISLSLAPEAAPNEYSATCLRYGDTWTYKIVESSCRRHGSMHTNL